MTRMGTVKAPRSLKWWGHLAEMPAGRLGEASLPKTKSRRTPNQERPTEANEVRTWREWNDSPSTSGRESPACPAEAFSPASETRVFPRAGNVRALPPAPF